MDTISFLSYILPDEGVKFIAVPKVKDSGGNYWKHIPASSYVQLDKTVKLLEAQKHQIYYACAVYKNQSIQLEDRKAYRVRENVLGAQAFWLDIDCGEGKDYPSQAEGLLALEEFLRTTELPRPLVVNSGNGIHVYWVVKELLDPDTWTRVATYLREICFAYGLNTDAKCTTDICRILRPVGTTNRKSEPGKPVFVIENKSYPLDTVVWVKKLKALAREARIVVAAKTVTVNEFAIPVNYRESSAYEIAKYCKQVKEFAACKGDVPEPRWYTMLGLLKHTVEGEEICQDWSSGHPSYDEGATSKKIMQWHKGPATCDSIRATNPGGCEGCKYAGSITSPITLGAVLLTMPKEPVIFQPEPDTVEGKTDKFDPTMPEFPIELMGSYSWDGQNLYTKDGSKDGTGGAIAICSTLIWPVSYHKDYSGSYKMVWRALHKSKTVDFELSGSAIAIGGREIWAELGSRGIIPFPGKKRLMENYVTSWFSALKRKAEETQVYNQFGWQKDGSFVLGTKQYCTNGEIKTVRLAGDAALPSYADAFVTRGTIEEWVELIDKTYNYPGQEQYQFMLAAGFGAPLLRLFENYGGLTINGFSPTKGLGKSTAGKLAIGIYGDPKLLIRSKQQTTYKAYIAHCGVMNSLPVMMDEATNIDPRELSDMLYTFSQGTPRVIMNRTGTMNMNQQSWSTIQLATANRSMVTLVGAMKASADAELGRIFEYGFEKVSTLKKSEADDILANSEILFGAVGCQYISYLVPNRIEVEALLNDTRRALDTRIGFTVQDRFVSAGLACVLTGARLANNLGLVKFNIEALTEWIVQQSRSFRSVVESTTPGVVDQFGRMLSEIARGFIVTQNMGEDSSNGKHAIVTAGPNGQYITGRYIQDEGLLYVQQSSIRQWCARNQADYNEVMHAVVTNKWCHHETVSFNLGQGTREYSLAPTKCWKLYADKMKGQFQEPLYEHKIKAVK